MASRYFERPIDSLVLAEALFEADPVICIVRNIHTLHGGANKPLRKSSIINCHDVYKTQLIASVGTTMCLIDVDGRLVCKARTPSTITSICYIEETDQIKNYYIATLSGLYIMDDGGTGIVLLKDVEVTSVASTGELVYCLCKLKDELTEGTHKLVALRPDGTYQHTISLPKQSNSYRLHFDGASLILLIREDDDSTSAYYLQIKAMVWSTIFKSIDDVSSVACDSGTSRLYYLTADGIFDIYQNKIYDLRNTDINCDVFSFLHINSRGELLIVARNDQGDSIITMLLSDNISTTADHIIQSLVGVDRIIAPV